MQPTYVFVDAPLTPLEYFIGLSLGQAQDPTALCILERHGEEPAASFHARYLHRYAPGTSYPSIVANVAELLARPELGIGKRPMLAVDATSVGAAPVQYLRQAKLNASLWPIIVTGGDQVTNEGGTYRVPKRDLVGVVQMGLQTNRLKVAASLPEAATLTNELQNFQVKATEQTSDAYTAWRTGKNDDLVFALALALWIGRRRTKISVLHWDR